MPGSKKQYDLEDRTFNYAKDVCIYCKKLNKTISNMEYVKQLIRSSASIGANYIEANEALSKKDFLHRVKISRKEAKESIYWLKLIKETNDNIEQQIENLINETTELKKILSAIIENRISLEFFHLEFICYLLFGICYLEFKN